MAIRVSLTREPSAMVWLRSWSAPGSPPIESHADSSSSKAHADWQTVLIGVLPTRHQHAAAIVDKCAVRTNNCACYRGSKRYASESINRDRKSTRLNSSHTVISYAVFCL